MNTPGSSPSNSPSRVRWFYSAVSLSLLVLMFIGFQSFYLQGMAYPGRPLTPPIRTLLIVHGCLMTAWMLLSVAQPLLVEAKRVRWHMRLGILGVVLAAAIVIVGVKVGIEAARFSPPGFLLFGLTSKEFLTVPLLGILMFGLFVLVGVLNRRRPWVHRPTMLLASVSVIGAALGRMGPLNALFAGTLWEQWFGGFLTSVLLAALFLLLKCLLSKSFDRWFAAGFVVFTASCAAITLIAKTAAWDRFATYVLQ